MRNILSGGLCEKITLCNRIAFIIQPHSPISVSYTHLRDYFARVSHADFTEPITAGIFVSIAAWASVQRRDDPTPYWRTLKANGELNAKYPGGVSAQKEKLEAEGHTVICRGRKNIRYFVKDYENALFDFTQGEQAS